MYRCCPSSSRGKARAARYTVRRGAGGEKRALLAGIVRLLAFDTLLSSRAGGIVVRRAR